MTAPNTGRPIARPFRPEDLGRLDVVGLQRHALEAVRDPVQLLEAGEVWTLETDGDVRLCAGMMYLAPKRMKAWALVGKAMTRRDWAVAAQKMGSRFTILQGEHGVQRIEAETPLDFAAGHRLLLHLGMRFECCLPSCGPGGETWVQYARYATRPNLPVRYDQLRALAWRTLIEDVIDPIKKAA